MQCDSSAQPMLPNQVIYPIILDLALIIKLLIKLRFKGMVEHQNDYRVFWIY